MGQDERFLFDWTDYVLNELYTTQPVVLLAAKDNIEDLKLKPIKLVQIDSKHYETSMGVD